MSTSPQKTVLSPEADFLSPGQDWEPLFDELCRAHRLKWRQKWLLKTMSQSLNVEPAVRLFIEPDWFVAAAKVQGLQHRKRQIADLCKLLFQREPARSAGKNTSQEEKQNEHLTHT